MTTDIFASSNIQLLGAVLLSLLFLQVLINIVSQVKYFVEYRKNIKQSQRLFDLKLEATLVQLQNSAGLTHSWNGFRKFEIFRKEMETHDVYSFYLRAHDKKSIASFHPGQYLTFKFSFGDNQKSIRRCYSLSESPHVKDYYRITIKKIDNGLVSGNFHENIIVGDIVDVKAPAGHFVLNEESTRPVVLLAGGVGLTPLLSMVNTLSKDSSKRETHIFLGVKSSEDHLMRKQLNELAVNHPHVGLNVCYSQPLAQDERGKDYNYDGWVSVDLLKTILPSNNYEFYICGTPQMMKSISGDLEAWGVPKSDINIEAFGSASVQKQTITTGDAGAKVRSITFTKTGKTFEWTSGKGSLLEFAEANSVFMDSGCRAGNCGSCLVAIKSGQVSYLTTPGADPEEGSCLACVAIPETDLELDV